MPRFTFDDPLEPSSSDIGFEDFITISKGLSISSAAATSDDSKGPDFLELGLSKAFNLRIQARNNKLVVSLVSILNKDDIGPIRFELIGEDEHVTAELLERRLHHLRQLYAIALLVDNDREGELAGLIAENSNADIEHELVSEEDKLIFREATPGSLIISLMAQSKKTYQAILYACAIPFKEGRAALIGRLRAGTALKELEVDAKAQDNRFKGAHGVLDLARKIDGIKNKETRELIRERFHQELTGITITDGVLPKPQQQNSLTQHVGNQTEQDEEEPPQLLRY